MRKMKHGHILCPKMFFTSAACFKKVKQTRINDPEVLWYAYIYVAYSTNKQPNIPPAWV
jgi:hypothetical protein